MSDVDTFYAGTINNTQDIYGALFTDADSFQSQSMTFETVMWNNSFVDQRLPNAPPGMMVGL